MWQAPNQRLRAMANAKKRERDRYKIPFHIKRVVASVQLTVPGDQPQTFEARTLLNDFSPRGMGLFSGHCFSQGDEVVVTIESPQKISVKGRIAWCQEYFVVGKVLKSQSFSYRAGISFQFASAEEEAAVRKFCDDLLNTHHCVSLRPGGSASAPATQASAPPAQAPAPDAALSEAAAPGDAPAAESAPADAPATDATQDAAAAPAPEAAPLATDSAPAAAGGDGQAA